MAKVSKRQLLKALFLLLTLDFLVRLKKEADTDGGEQLNVIGFLDTSDASIEDIEIWSLNSATVVDTELANVDKYERILMAVSENFQKLMDYEIKMRENHKSSMFYNA
jgi:hypothetical protein